MNPEPSFNIQPTLENDIVLLLPLHINDFDSLYELGSDPLIWEQHPNQDRWKLEAFTNYFEGAVRSRRAFKIVYKPDGELAGCTRIYDYVVEENSIKIGYTFIARKFWSKGINPAAKKLLLDYLFQYVEKVQFHIGSKNIRSQIAIGKLGAKKISEEEIAYYGEPPKLNYLYQIEKADWVGR